MTKDQRLAVGLIMEIMLRLEPAEREEVWLAVTHNEVFCVHCGTGQIGAPNPQCQCTNDE